jgi:hypothetical protein
MALVVLALNGEGLGHLIRATAVCEVLHSVGERPVLFSQGTYQPGGRAFPGKYVPSLWRATEEVRRQVSADLYAMAAISIPKVIVEDTHPNPIRIPPDVRRVLLVRPTSYEYLNRLNARYRSVYSAFILSDTPGSPTWPYSDTQTKMIATWKKWQVSGPIYRTPSQTEIGSIRLKYGISEGQELCVFTMGGGGLHDPNDRDVERFISLSNDVASIIRGEGNHVRLIFVRGPYFPSNARIPPHFEVVHEEKQMPALLAVAKGAVIRAGFNTTWECLAAGTPFIPLIGTTFGEPVSERLDRLRTLDLVPGSYHQFWFDNDWRNSFASACRRIVAEHPSVPIAGELQRFVLGNSQTRDDSHQITVSRAQRRPHIFLRKTPHTSRRRIPFIIRIDDIVSDEPTVSWLLRLMAARELRASLEVVPYLTKIDDEFLDQFDPARKLFEVSQHGFAHVPRRTQAGHRCEFFPDSESATLPELAAIGAGKRQLESAFPKRFSGGFSPPFDALPRWLPEAWRLEGGAFVSCLYTNCLAGAPIAIVRAGVDIWDWREGRSVRFELLVRKLGIQVASDRHIGIVLHPRCLRNPRERDRLLLLLDILERHGTQTASLRELAMTKSMAPPSVKEKWRARLRRWFSPKIKVV